MDEKDALAVAVLHIPIVVDDMREVMELRKEAINYLKKELKNEN